MGRREEIEKLSQVVYESGDLPTLERTHEQFAQLLQSMRQNLQGTTDEDVVNLLNELIEQAESADQDLKQKIAAIKVDMLDPSYAARKAEEAREKAAEQAKAEEMTRKIQEGIGGFLGSLGLGSAFGGLGGGSAKPAAPATPAAPAAPAASGAAAGAKFCSECGSPLGGAKFCPECGTRAS